MQEADLGDEDEAMVDNEESFQDSHMETKFSEGASMGMTGETNQLQDEDDDDNDYYEEDFEVSFQGKDSVSITYLRTFDGNILYFHCLDHLIAKMCNILFI